MNYNKFLLAIVLGLVILNTGASADPKPGISLIKVEEFPVSMEGYKQLLEEYVNIRSELENRLALGEHYLTAKRIGDLEESCFDLTGAIGRMRISLVDEGINREHLYELVDKAKNEVIENLLRAEVNVTGELSSRVDRVKKLMIDENLRKN